MVEKGKKNGLPDYSWTWRQNSHLSSMSVGRVNPHNFFTFSTFAGLYDRPSPFVYRKHVVPELVPELPVSVLSVTKNALKVFKEWFRMKTDGFTLWFRFRFLVDGGSNLESRIPPKNGLFNYETPFFFSFSRRKVNGPYLKAAEQVALLESCLDLSGITEVCEIGAGFGALAETIIFSLRPRRYVIVDLPETLDISFAYLSAEAGLDEALFRRTFGRGEWKDKTIQMGETEITFLDASKSDFHSLRGIDLFLNSNSFSEMDRETLQKYLTLVSQNRGAALMSANPRRTEGSSNFDPDLFAQSESGWKLVLRSQQAAHSSFRGNIVTVHRVEN